MTDNKDDQFDKCFDAAFKFAANAVDVAGFKPETAKMALASLTGNCMFVPGEDFIIDGAEPLLSPSSIPGLPSKEELKAEGREATSQVAHRR